MCANVLSSCGHLSHLRVLRPSPNPKFRTSWLCHMTPTDSGTLPSILVDRRLTMAPLRPVISVGGMRVVLVMCTRHHPRFPCDNSLAERVHLRLAGDDRARRDLEPVAELQAGRRPDDDRALFDRHVVADGRAEQDRVVVDRQAVTD